MRSGFVCLTIFTSLALGCGGGGTNSVSGKVTYNGKGVAGTISFIGSDGKKVDAPLTDGDYTINNPPLGQVKVAIMGMPDVGSGATIPKDLKAKTEVAAGDAKKFGGVAPPMKYAAPYNGLTYEVKAGKQTHNIELK